MALSKIIKREFEVAFSKHAQPLWLRLTKYIALVFLFYFLWGTTLLWVILSIVFVCGMSLHFWYRHKTQGWTKSYGLWDYDKNKPKQN